MSFSNDGASYSSWEPFTSLKAWELTELEGDKTVYLKMRDQAGNISAPTSDSIELDYPPAGTFAINDEAIDTIDRSVQLISDVTDDPSGVCTIELRNQGEAWSSQQPYEATIQWLLAAGDGTKTVEARYTSCVGYQTVLSDTINLDTSLTILYGSLAISHTNTITGTNPDVILTSKGYTDTAWMRFAHTADDLPTADWLPYAINHNWQLRCDQQNYASVHGGIQTCRWDNVPVRADHLL